MNRNFIYVKPHTLGELRRIVTEIEAEGLSYRTFNSDPGEFIIEIEYMPNSRFLRMLPVSCFKTEPVYTMGQR